MCEVSGPAACPGFPGLPQPTSLNPDTRADPDLPCGLRRLPGSPGSGFWGEHKLPGQGPGAWGPRTAASGIPKLGGAPVGKPAVYVVKSQRLGVGCQAPVGSPRPSAPGPQEEPPGPILELREGPFELQVPVSQTLGAPSREPRALPSDRTAPPGKGRGSQCRGQRGKGPDVPSQWNCVP